MHSLNGFLPCKLAGDAAFILRTQFPEDRFAPSVGKFTLFEIVASERVPPVHVGARLTLEYDA